MKTSRPYRDIIKTNVFNPVNVVLYAIAFGMLMALGPIVLDVPSPDAVNLGAHLPPTTLE